MQHNIILNCDSYKHSMWKQYPPKTEVVYDYIESRGGLYDKTVFFGIQAFIKEYLLRPITMENIDEAESFLKEHGLPFNREGCGEFKTVLHHENDLEDYLETTYYHGKQDDNYPLTFEIDFETVKNNLENS